MTGASGKPEPGPACSGFAFPMLARAVLTGAVFAAGCASAGTTDRGIESERPAVLIAPTAETRAELAHLVSEAMHGVPVRLAADALTTASELTVTRVERRDAAGHPLLGRSTERPERFQLLERGGRCILVEEGTGRRWALRSGICAPAAPR
jgi:hypothetical protein